ncbi:ferric reductase-like transmembrane domain-containing protein [Pontiellaceae bacterium B1224]|nr:ferric reductase-like transmembrane domain-containing protein [Pontiellaceae bacterium B1224]
MTKWIFMPIFLLFFVLTPIGLALSQDVPTKTTYQAVVLLVSLGAFGLMLSLFWLSRLMPKNTVKMKYSTTLRWHKYIGYAAGLFFLIHPVLMIARRFWVVESNPMHNLMLMIKSPLMLTGIVAWFLMIILVVVAFVRKKIPAKLFRYIHGLLSIGFVGFASWHVILIGRHSNPAMSAFWIVLAGGAVAALLVSYLPHRSEKTSIIINIGDQHESA